MALREREDSMTYVGVFDGKLEVRVQKDTPGAISREKTKQGKPTGDLIYVKTYGSLEGIVTDVKKDVKELPDGTKFSSLKVFINDMGDKYVLNWPYDSNLTSAFFHMMENIDYNSPVEFSVGKSKDKKGKERNSLFIKQFGANIKWKYTKDYQYAAGEKKKPEWVEKEIKGEKVWDNTDEIRFFESIIKDKILPKLRSKQEEAPKSSLPFDMDEYIPTGNIVKDEDWIPGNEPVEKAPDEDMPF